MIRNENKIENIKCVLLGFAPKPSGWHSQQAIRHSRLSGWGSNSLATLHPGHSWKRTWIWGPDRFPCAMLRSYSN